MIYSHGPKPKRFTIVKCAPLMLFHFLLGLLVAAEQIVRGLCVCSFGLRTIAVLMSLFPSLGISSFHTAVCCDGENEYTTPA